MRLFIIFLLLSVSVVNFAQDNEGNVNVTLGEEPGIKVFKRGVFYGLEDYRYPNRTIVLPPVYDQITPDTKGRYVVQQDGYTGVYHARLKRMVIPMLYTKLRVRDLAWRTEELHNDTTFVVVAESDGYKGLLDHAGNTLLSLEYSDITVEDHFVICKKDGQAGVNFFDKTKKNIPVEYSDVQARQAEGIFYFIAKKNDRYVLFSDRGALLVDNQLEMDAYRHAIKGKSSTIIWMVDAQRKHGAFDLKKMDYVLSARYDGKGLYYRDDQFIVKKQGKFGVVGVGDKVLIPFQYDTLHVLLPGNGPLRFKAMRGARYALLTAKNKALTSFDYLDIEANGPAFTAKVDKGYTLIDSMGRRITSEVYDQIGLFLEGRCRVVLKDKAGYIDTRGVVVSPITEPNHARGYRTVEELFKGFERAMKADNEAALMEFCRDVAVDDYSLEFMRRIGFDFRFRLLAGFITAKEESNNYALFMRDYQDIIKRRGEFESLKFLYLEEGVPGYREEAGQPQLLSAKAWGNMSTIKGRHVISLGELVYLDGYWKAIGYPAWYRINAKGGLDRL